MAIRVSPTEKDPTHDISLSNGVTTVGLHLAGANGGRDRRAIRQTSTPRTSLQTQSGDPNYSGFNLPFTPVTQKDWSGGRANKQFHKDGARYYDGHGVNTIHGNIFLGPKATATSDYVTTDEAGNGITGGLPTQVGYLNLADYDAVIASRITPDTSYTVGSIKLGLHLSAAGSELVGIALFSQAGGTPLRPGTLLHTTYVTVTNTTPAVHEIPFGYAVTGGTAYYVAISPAVVPYTNSKLVVQYDTVEVNKTILDSPDMSNWTIVDTDKCMYIEFRGGSDGHTKFFQYRGSQMAVFTPKETITPKLYINGHRGFATDNTGDKEKLKTTLSFAGVTLGDNAVAKVIAGPGNGDNPNYRHVDSYTQTGTNDYVQVDATTDRWSTTHTTATEFVILGENNWYEITSHGLTGPITDVLVVGDIIYFAQGDSVVVRKGRLSAGTWSWDDEGATTKATFMKFIPETNGTSKIWLAQATTSNVYSADPVAWSTDLTLVQSNDAKPVGNSATKITNLIAYGEPRIPYILKEDGLGSIRDGIYAEVPNAELAAVASENNGRSATVYGVYLFFSLLEGFERFYDQYLDDIGPNRDEGLAANRQGPIVAATPYPGGVLVAIDGSTSGYSSIMFWSGSTGGWHELYRGDIGQRITDMQIQVIPGLSYQYLWFNQGQDILWIPLAINPLKAEGYPFTDTGYLVTANYRTGMGEINKFFKSLMTFAQMNGGTITVYYQLDEADDDDAWTALPSVFDSGPVEEILLATAYNVTGKEIRLKIQLDNASETTTPIITATTLNAVTRVPPAKTWSVTFQADDVNIQQGQGEDEALDMDGLIEQLDIWSDSNQQAAPITMRSVIPQYDNKRVFVDAPNVQIREVSIDSDTRVIKAIGNLNIYEA